MGWQGSATHRDNGAEPDTSPQIGTDGDIFYLPSPNAPSCIITDSATKKQEGADSSLVKASIKPPGPGGISEAECVCYTLQKDHISADKFRCSYIGEEGGGVLMPRQLLQFVEQV